MEIRKIVDQIDKILDKEGIALLRIKDKKYEITGYSIVGGYIILYFGEDNLGTFFVRDITDIRKIMQGE